MKYFLHIFPDFLEHPLPLYQPENRGNQNNSIHENARLRQWIGGHMFFLKSGVGHGSGNSW